MKYFLRAIACLVLAMGFSGPASAQMSVKDLGRVALPLGKQWLHKYEVVDERGVFGSIHYVYVLENADGQPVAGTSNNYKEGRHDVRISTEVGIGRIATPSSTTAVPLKKSVLVEKVAGGRFGRPSVKVTCREPAVCGEIAKQVASAATISKIDTKPDGVEVYFGGDETALSKVVDAASAHILK